MEVNPHNLHRSTDTENSDAEYDPASGSTPLHAETGLKTEAAYDSDTLLLPQQEDQMITNDTKKYLTEQGGSAEKYQEELEIVEPCTENQGEQGDLSKLQMSNDDDDDGNKQAESLIPEELNAHYNDNDDQSKEQVDVASKSNDDIYEPDMPTSRSEILIQGQVEDSNKLDSENYKPEASINDEDDYDPELDQKPVGPPSLPSRPPTGLPPKPAQTAKSVPSTTLISNQGEMAKALRDAYNAFMHSDFTNDPEFLQLPQEEQVRSIQELLSERGIDLSKINFDQVYSYNKPFKQLKDPIPLVPVSEFCRRPNITVPLTPDEEKEYEEFIERENYYMNLQNWDEFPDKLRLFVGNLPANTVSKQDLFRIFNKYGEVIQIAIKAGYGFVQFRTGEACLECVKGETDVPIHNKVLRLDASKPQKSRRPGHPEVNNPNLSSRGRERPNAEEPVPKRRKGDFDCIVYTTGKSSVFFIRQVKKAFAKCQVLIETEDVTQKNINEVLSEAAYAGYLGACVIKEHKVDVQTYEEQPNGGIKFDEYADIDPEEAAEVMSKAKLNKYGGNPPPYYPPDTNYFENVQDRGNRQHDRDRNRGNFGRNNRRGKGKHGHQNNPGYVHNNYDRHRNNYTQQLWPNLSQQQLFLPHQQQPYGQIPQTQFSQFSQLPQTQGQFTPSPYGFQQPHQQPVYNQYSSPQPPSLNLNQPNLAQALQSLNADQVQSMINLLQQQQQPVQQGMPSPPPFSLQNHNPVVSRPAQGSAHVPAPAAYGQPPPLNYGDRGGGRRDQSHGLRSRPYGNVPQPHQNPSLLTNANQSDNSARALLSQLQAGTYNQGPNSQQPGSNSALMETLRKLARR